MACLSPRVGIAAFTFDEARRIPRRSPSIFVSLPAAYAHWRRQARALQNDKRRSHLAGSFTRTSLGILREPDCGREGDGIRRWKLICSLVPPPPGGQWNRSTRSGRRRSRSVGEVRPRSRRRDIERPGVYHFAAGVKAADHVVAAGERGQHDPVIEVDDCCFRRRPER